MVNEAYAAIVHSKEVEVRFPVVECIDVRPCSDTKTITSYVVRTARGQSFTSGVIEAVSKALEEKIPGVRLTYGLDTHDGQHFLTVACTPRDSYQGNGRFEVYDVLQGVFSPKTHTAIMRPTRLRLSPVGFNADLWLIGQPDKPTLQELESRLRATGRVAHVEPVRRNDKPHQFTLIVNGPLEDARQFIPELRQEAGVQLVVLLDQLR